MRTPQPCQSRSGIAEAGKAAVCPRGTCRGARVSRAGGKPRLRSVSMPPAQEPVLAREFDR